MAKITAYDKFIQQALKYGFSLFGTAPTEQTVQYRLGDDGGYEKGYPRTGPRFVDNDDGTITDKATGLMWPKSGTGVGCFSGGTKTWNNGIDWALALDFAGHTDWRLPNVKEITSITAFDRINSAINPTFFPDTINSAYWTSTTYAGDTAKAWEVWLANGQCFSALKSAVKYLRAVRLGYPA